MLRHRERRALPVAREAGVGYARVLRHSVADAAFDEPAAQHAQADALDVYPVVELEQVVVLYSGDERLVEGVVDAVDVVAAAAALVGVERLGEARDCRQIQLVVVRGQRVGLDERADLEYLMYVADGDGADHYAALRVDAHEPLLREPPYRFAHRRAREAELFAEQRLAQHVVRRVFAALDFFADELVRLILHRRVTLCGQSCLSLYFNVWTMIASFRSVFKRNLITTDM